MFSIRAVSDISEAQKIWQKISPQRNIYEDWNFRFVFYKYFNYPLEFYVGEEDGEIVGLLPLQFNSDEGYLEFFGGSFMEDNHVFIKPGFEGRIPEFYAAVKSKARLEDIIFDNDFVQMSFMENKYIIKLDGIAGADDYLAKFFSSKTRKKIKKRNEEMEALGIKVSYDEASDLSELIRLNKEAFGAESSFNKPYRKEIYRDLLESAFRTITVSASIGGKKQNVSLAIAYKDAFVSFSVGNNKDDFPDLGHYMFLKRVERALALGCRIYDAGLGDLGWKSRWHLEKIPEYLFESK